MSDSLTIYLDDAFADIFGEQRGSGDRDDVIQAAPARQLDLDNYLEDDSSSEWSVPIFASIQTIPGAFKRYEVIYGDKLLSRHFTKKNAIEALRRFKRRQDYNEVPYHILCPDN